MVKMSLLVNCNDITATHAAQGQYHLNQMDPLGKSNSEKIDTVAL